MSQSPGRLQWSQPEPSNTKCPPYPDPKQTGHNSKTNVSSEALNTGFLNNNSLCQTENHFECQGVSKWCV